VTDTRPYQTSTIPTLARETGWSAIRKDLGVRSFGVNAWTAKAAGDDVIPLHDEVPSRHEELYVLLTGRATFTVGSDEIAAEPGTIVYVPDPAATRGAVAHEAGTTVLSMGGEPGAVYAPRDWETNAEVFPLLDAGEFAAARDLLHAAIAERGQEASLLYNLACAEAGLGETDAALEHLRASIADRPELAASAQDDHDLEPLRADPRFAAIVAPTEGFDAS
jgi:hypothetical protein